MSALAHGRAVAGSVTQAARHEHAPASRAPVRMNYGAEALVRARHPAHLRTARAGRSRHPSPRRTAGPRPGRGCCLKAAQLVRAAFIVVGRLRDTTGSSATGAPDPTESPSSEDAPVRADRRLAPLIRCTAPGVARKIGQEPLTPRRVQRAGRGLCEGARGDGGGSECIFLRNKLF